MTEQPASYDVNGKDKNLLLCPFCGRKPNAYESDVDIGCGDYQYVYKIICECAANPVVSIPGEHGYLRDDDTPNAEAKERAIEAWNTRVECK